MARVAFAAEVLPVLVLDPALDCNFHGRQREGLRHRSEAISGLPGAGRPVENLNFGAQASAESSQSITR